ncbi:MAG: tRNA (5-methylaminomethyl-2-thiouridylate)-methyltransferase, partial [Pseudomonadota bacterium]
YSVKLADLWSSRGRRDYGLDDIMLLKVGRHIRPRPHFKLIVAREEGESRYLQGYRKEFAHFEVESHGGPVTLVDGEPTADELELSARIVARYSQGRDAGEVTLAFTDRAGVARRMQVAPLPPHEVRSEWML